MCTVIQLTITINVYVILLSSTTFTQSVPKATEFGEITLWLGLVRAITPFKIIQGHGVWYQSKAHMRLPISD